MWVVALFILAERVCVFCLGFEFVFGLWSFRMVGYDLVAVILLLCYFVCIGNLVWLRNGVVVMYECCYVGLWV